MSIVQTLKAEWKRVTDEIEVLFNQLGGDPELLKAKIRAKTDELKNAVDDHCRAHSAQILSDVGLPIPHDTTAAEQAEAAVAEHGAQVQPVTVVGSPDAVAAAVAEDPTLQTVEDVADQVVEDPTA